MKTDDIVFGIKSMLLPHCIQLWPDMNLFQSSSRFSWDYHLHIPNWQFCIKETLYCSLGILQFLNREVKLWACWSHIVNTKHMKLIFLFIRICTLNATDLLTHHYWKSYLKSIEHPLCLANFFIDRAAISCNDLWMYACPLMPYHIWVNANPQCYH